MSVYTAEVRVAAGDLVDRMTEMRVWLDHRHFEPLVFRYASIGSSIEVRVEFAIEDEARAFAAEFHGHLVR